MNKKIHKKVNIIETVCVLVCVLCMSVSAILHANKVFMFNPALLIVSSIAEIFMIAIELMLFHLETIKYKFITIAFYVIELIMLMIVNMKVPFSGLIVLVTFSIAKNVFRIMKVEEIYQFLGYYELCKKFGIKVKRPRKARMSATKKVSTPVKNKKKASVKEEPTFA